MKIKNTLLLAFACSAFFTCSAENNTDESSPTTTSAAFFEEVLDNNKSPLGTSMQSLRNFFISHDVQRFTIKSRSCSEDSKTSSFNESFIEYIKRVYNQPTYAEYLSRDASHIIEFSELGSELHLTPEYMYVGLRLFYNKLKGTEIIDDTVVLQLLPAISRQLEGYFDPCTEETRIHNLESFDFVKRRSEEIILYKFTQHFTEFQATPDLFVNKLAGDLAAFYKQQDDIKIQEASQQETKNESLTRLRHMVIRFFELSLSKIMWNIYQPEVIWPSVKALACNLRGLAEYGVINHMDDLDDLLWSLTHRFNYFLDLTGADLPIKFYDQIEEDLVNRNVFFLEAKEQDEGIVSKKQLFIEALVRSKAKAIANQRGVFANL